MPCFLSKRLALGAALCSTALLLPFVGMADSSLPAATIAQTPAKPPVDEDARRMADRQAYVAAHLAALQAGLQLTPDQSSLWPPVASALQDLAKIRGHRHGDYDEEGTPLEALTRQSEHLIAKGEAMKKLADATGPLLASLTDDQKHRLPILIEGLGPRHILGRAFAINDGRDRPREDRADKDHWEHRVDGGFDRDDDHRGDRMFGSHEHREDADGREGDRHRGWGHSDRDTAGDGFDRDGGWFGGHRHEHRHFDDDDHG